MKKLLIAMFMLAWATLSVAQEQPRALFAIYSSATFNDVAGTPYVETYFVFDGNSLTYKYVNKDTLRATIEVLMQVRRDDTLMLVKKYQLNSPYAILKRDSEESYLEYDMPDFIDMQRVALPNGEYDITFQLKDLNSTNKAIEVEDHVSVLYLDGPQLSSVQPMASAVKTTTPNIMSRSGYDMTPYINDFYPETVKALNFYYEIYHIDKEIKNEPFVTIAYIEQRETGRRYEAEQVTKRQKSSSLVPVFGTLDISMLPSGNYNLVVEARNRNNDLLLFHRVPFMRSNPNVAGEAISSAASTFAGAINDEDLLNYYISALYPIATPKEESTAESLQRLKGNISDKQNFFYQFWVSRDKLNPEGKWREYKERLDYVDQHFSYGKRRGYLTDMGRVYLQYGKPSHIRDEKNFVSTRYLGHGDQTANTMEGNFTQNTSLGYIYYLPYQIWRYDLLAGDDANRCFLFWDEQRTGYYLLLHSNARGEVQDPTWERRLSQQQLNENVYGEVTQQFERGY